MKKFLITISAVFLVCTIYCQDVEISPVRQKTIDSLKQILATSKLDSNRVLILFRLSTELRTFISLEESLKYAREGAIVAHQVNAPQLESQCLRRLGSLLHAKGQTAEALFQHLKALRLSESIGDDLQIGLNSKELGNFYLDQRDFGKAKHYLFQSKRLLEKVSNDRNLAIALLNLGDFYFKIAQWDSAIAYYEQSYQLGLKTNNTQTIVSALIGLGRAYTEKQDYLSAMSFLRQSLTDTISRNVRFILNQTYLSIANVYQKTGNTDSLLFYAKRSYELSEKETNLRGMLEASKLLAKHYDKQDEIEAYKYVKVINKVSDSLYSLEKAQAVQNLGFQEEQRRQSIEAARNEEKSRFRFYVVLGILFTCLIIALILYRNNRQKQKAKVRIEKAYAELKSTQAQLIQSEKMASLGELTAGIAHEIQNPLNFVNNFSEVNAELITEMKQEIESGNLQEVQSIADNIQENQEKINHHGKRADAIVKGMLQHSRASTGQKEPTDLNVLVDEYIRLSYHGLRAKDKSFNATIQTDFNPAIEKINIVPQDIGRVLLNLLNNAFYAASEKKRKIGEGYDPTVTVATKKVGNKVVITIKDNGPGIPENVREKIFQPFFTTKPTGHGTGLGLSLSYDIIKAHGGEINADSIEGEYALFTIQLPFTNN